MFGKPNKALEIRPEIEYNSITTSLFLQYVVRFSERWVPDERQFVGRIDQMDVTKMLAELRQEREQIEEAIISLERLARGRGKRRGRPPAWMTEVKKRGRPPGSKNEMKLEGKPSAAAKAAVA